MSNRKIPQNRYYLHVLRHLLAQIEALVEAHLFRWVLGSKSDQKGSKTQHFHGERATCKNQDFRNASPVAFGTP